MSRRGKCFAANWNSVMIGIVCWQEKNAVQRCFFWAPTPVFFPLSGRDWQIGRFLRGLWAPFTGASCDQPVQHGHGQESGRRCSWNVDFQTVFMVILWESKMLEFNLWFRSCQFQRGCTCTCYIDCVQMSKTRWHATHWCRLWSFVPLQNARR